MDELSFVSYVEGAETDLEGLAHFDTNGNGELDPGDAEWSKFRVRQDLDRDGVSDVGELRTLDEAGITEISLTSDGVERTVSGNTVFGEGGYTDADIVLGTRHRSLPAAYLLQHRYLIPQAGEVDMDGAGFRVLPAASGSGGCRPLHLTNRHASVIDSRNTHRAEFAARGPAGPVGSRDAIPTDRGNGVWRLPHALRRAPARWRCPPFRLLLDREELVREIRKRRRKVWWYDIMQKELEHVIW